MCKEATSILDQIIMAAMSTQAAIIFSALLGIFSAWMALRGNRKIAKEKATMDLLVRIGEDVKFVESFRIIKKLSKEDHIITKFADADLCENQEELDSAAAIRYILNKYEHLAIGIFDGIYDESKVKRGHQGTMLRVYKFTKHFIDECQTRYSNTSYENYSKLIEKWKHEKKT